ncbi:MAG: hypothetical protein QM726_09105 [Chitinophagaceae bacterium]
MLPTIPGRSRLLWILLSLLAISLFHAHTVSGQQFASFTTGKPSASAIPVKKNYDEDARSWYAVYNTGNTLHVYLAVTDPVQQRKIVMNGLEIWIDAKGKKNKKTGILFPIALTDKMPKPQPGLNNGNNRPGGFIQGNGVDTNAIHDLEKNIAQQHEMKLTGFKDELNGLQSTQHPSGIAVALYFSKDTLIYEAQLPLNTLSETIPLNSRVSVGIVEKGRQMGIMGDGNGMPPPDGGGPGGGGDGNMPPPGGPPPFGEDGMRIFEDNTIWCKLTIEASGT